MSTLRVNSIENGGAAVNFTTDLAVGNGKAIREYYAQADEPSGAGNGAVWWDTANNVYKLLIEGSWYTVDLVLPPPPYLGSRGIFGGGVNVSYSNVNTIDYITIATPGNATDFGDLLATVSYPGACSDSTRGVFGGGESSFSASNVIQYITIATTGNAIDFGDLTAARQLWGAGCSNGTRGLFGGGQQVSTTSNFIDYITIATPGNAIDFGDLTVARYGLASCSDVTYGLFAGGRNASNVNSNVIDYVTIATIGNAIDFGDLTGSNTWYIAGTSNATRGVFAGGAPTQTNIIQYVTITTPGNATDFGDLLTGKMSLAACSDNTYATFAGGETSLSEIVNTIQYIVIDTPGNSTDFGDLTIARYGAAGCSGN